MNTHRLRIIAVLAAITCTICLFGFKMHNPTNLNKTRINGIAEFHLSIMYVNCVDSLTLSSWNGEEITSFNFVLAPREGEAKLIEVDGSTLPEEARKYMISAKVGDRIIIDRIRAQGAKSKVTLQPAMYELTP